jgi:hypothetical protein
MRRPTLALAAVLAFVAIDVVACNTISGVGDFTFAAASSTAGAGGSMTTTTPSTGGSGGKGGSGGAAGGPGVEVACPVMKCPVTPDGGACCFDNPTEHDNKAAGRCVDMPAIDDGCITDSSDGGKETRIECSGPADCAGLSCCATYGGMNPDAGAAWYSIVTCKSACGPSDITLCDPDAGTCASGNNPEGGVCNQSKLLPPGYFVCP